MHLKTLSFIPLTAAGVLALEASMGCFGAGSSTASGTGGKSSSSSTGTGGAKTNGTWTAIQGLPDKNTSYEPGSGSVTGLWFSSVTNGVVSFDAGVIEHFNGATQIDSVVLSGFGAAPHSANDVYYNFTMTPIGLLVANGYAQDSLVVSTDQGKTFTYSTLYGMSSAPGGIKPGVKSRNWLQVDSNKVWHLVDVGGLWDSPAAPSASATFTDSWHPVGTPSVPDPLPAADCTTWGDPGVGLRGYYALVPGSQTFWASSDGKTMIYQTDAGLCRSTDGGKNFLPIPLNNVPNYTVPWNIMFTSDTIGIAAFGSDVSTSYVHYTSDGGKTWTPGALPSKLPLNVAITNGFASPSGAMFLEGGYLADTPGGGTAEMALLVKSTDHGKTWTDIGAKVTDLKDKAGGGLRLTAGFALDDNNIWIGGEGGFLAYSSTGGM